MANLSKEKRDKMIAFLDNLKNEYFASDEKIRAINEIENYLNEKKYGLVWEQHSEEVDDLLEDLIPVFTNDASKGWISNSSEPLNFLLEGDNLHSLYLLAKTHRRKIDVIYIDPPYNTGAASWKYNNDYIDGNDSFKHSHWASFMFRRLSAAKELLKDDGVLICAIDENEIATLKLLLEEVFGASYIVDVVTIVHNPRGIQGDNFSYTNEFALFVYKKGYTVITNRVVQDDEIDWSPLRNWGGESLRTDARNCFYGIRTKYNEIVGFEDVLNDAIHPQKNEERDGEIVVYPIDNNGIERKWRYARQTVESIKSQLRVKRTNGVTDIELGKPYAPYKTVWTDKRYDANEYGTQWVRSMVPNCDFDFPKSIWNVYDCLYAVASNRENAIILDFFAGSGTTGHAVELLNHNLGGHRSYILATNNEVGQKKERQFEREIGAREDHAEEWDAFLEENGICSSITYKRMKAVNDGYIHRKDTKTELYAKKFGKRMLENISSVKDEVYEIIESNQDAFDSVNLSFDDGKITVIGVVKKGEVIPGLPHNLRYYKTDFTDRYPEEHYLTDALCLHIKEMIELSTAQVVDENRQILALTKNDFTKKIKEASDIDTIERIWIRKSLLLILTPEERQLLESLTYRTVPDEFFNTEIREVAE